MEAQKSQSKLTRTQSSLLRSSPTVRSPIHSVTEDEEEYDKKKRRTKPGSTIPGSTGFNPIQTMVSLTIFTIFALSFLFFFYYSNFEEVPTSESLLFFLLFIAIALFFATKNKSFINQNIGWVKQIWEDGGFLQRLKLYPSKNKPRKIQWFIGENNEEAGQKGGVEGKVIREGVEFYSNGDYYEGEFYRGKCNGSGVYNFFVKGRYEGEWVEGRYDGYGIESWAKGSKYRGQYRGGLRHGVGVYRFYTGDSYAGEWYNGQSHGVGVQNCSDGSCFLGEFKLGVKHGLGVYHFRNGDRYAGEYFSDKIHGFGVYHFANGHCYEGSWYEGRRQGYGMYTFRSGDTKCGEWDGGTLKTPLPPLNDAVLRAVLSARRTAENAVHLRRVDDQVSKAVQAANRAATAARVAAVKAVQNRMDGRFCDTNV